ncbi:MAG: DUF1634 domain-containing protein [Chloroflexota bacterium]|nr:MAG: DUF1634 domain-containing protein [Chloroflexota bacterium]
MPTPPARRRSGCSSARRWDRGSSIGSTPASSGSCSLSSSPTRRSSWSSGRWSSSDRPVTAPAAKRSIEASVSRALKVGIYAAVALVGVGVGLMVINGRSPLEIAPSLDPGSLVADLVALRPSAFLWLGVLVVLATPPLRVATALIGYLRDGEREMGIVALLILVVIALGVVAGTAGS